MALRAFLRDRQDLLLRLGQQLVQLLERLLVKLEWRAIEDHVGVLQVAGICRRAQVGHEIRECLAGQLSAEA